MFNTKLLSKGPRTAIITSRQIIVVYNGSARVLIMYCSLIKYDNTIHINWEIFLVVDDVTAECSPVNVASRSAVLYAVECVLAYLLPGVCGLIIAPITASVASVAIRGSDSNHLLRILVAGAATSS